MKALEKRIKERDELEAQRRDAEEQFLKQQNDNLDKFLKTFESTSKTS
jgi:hypothetical protein